MISSTLRLLWGYARLLMLILTAAASGAAFTLAMDDRKGPSLVFTLVACIGLVGYALHRALPEPADDTDPYPDPHVGETL